LFCRRPPPPPQEALQGVDVAFIALHGSFGEDGGIQRELKRRGVPYVGSDPFSSAITLHKAIAKDYARRAGILVPRHMVVGRSILNDTTGVAKSIESHFPPPYILKPLRSGSALGVRKVTSVSELARELYDVVVSYEQALVEEYIEGREATVGVVEHFRGMERYALPPIEIRPVHGVFDIAARYGDVDHTLCPSTFSLTEKRELERLAILAHDTLGMRHYSRTDFILAPAGIYFLETNSLPGMAERSLIPQALNVIGSSTKEFLTHVLTQALSPRAVAVRY
jgi:D-alanine-D-alanine ligase